MNHQAQEAGRRADELHAKLIADINAGNTEDEATPGANPNVTPAPNASAGSPEHQSEETWEQKFKVIDGKYRVEVPALHQEKRRLMQVIASHEQTIAALNAELATRQPGQQMPASDEHVERLRQIEDEFGSDIAGVLRELQGQVVLLQRENQLLKATPQGQQQMGQTDVEAPAQPQPAGLGEREKSLIAELAVYVGGEAELNRIDRDARFSAWLNEQDHPTSSESRREAMQRLLFQEASPEKAASYFITWRNQSSKGGATPAGQLDEHQQPPVNRGGSNAGGNSGKIWRMSEIRALQKDFSVKPIYRTPEGRKQAEALESEFLAAGSENRIINDLR